MLEDTSDRKIAVIFATDVVGYRKYIEQNENQTLINLKECRNILDKLITKNKGRIFNTGGDSVLAEFNSAVTAVECASKFQKQIRERNADSGEDKKMELMMFATANIYRTSGTSTNDVNDKMFTMGRVRGFTIKKKRKKREKGER